MSMSPVSKYASRNGKYLCRLWTGGQFPETSTTEVVPFSDLCVIAVTFSFRLPAIQGRRVDLRQVESR